MTEIKQRKTSLQTLLGCLVIEVRFDAKFWCEVARPKLVEFFRKYVVAEILTERVWRGLPLFGDDDVEPSDEEDDNVSETGSISIGDCLEENMDVCENMEGCNAECPVEDDDDCDGVCGEELLNSNWFSCTFDMEDYDEVEIS